MKPLRRTKTATPRGEVESFILTNDAGASVELISVGAGIRKVTVADRNGNLEDVTLGYEDLADYFTDGPGAGKIPGRYANRIAHGRFCLDGKEYRLPLNLPPHHLHGGADAFHYRNWAIEDAGDDFVTFALVSPNSDAGYPGRLEVRATYRWSEGCELSLTLEARTDAPTVINLTNHAYWNLSGHKSPSAMDHLLQVNASRYLATDPTLVPTGEFAPVGGTPMDFRNPRAIGPAMDMEFKPLKEGKGYDHCWVIDGHPGEMRTAAVLSDPASGRILEVLSDQPGAQVYTGNWLTGSPRGKDGAEYADYCALAIECQDFPDAPNRPEFPSTVLRPGEKYHRTIIYRFKTNL